MSEVDLTPVPPRGRRRWWAVGAVLAVMIAVAAAGVAVASQRALRAAGETGRAASVACPDAFDDVPSAGASGDRLIPEDPPVGVTICRYVVAGGVAEPANPSTGAATLTTAGPLALGRAAALDPNAPTTAALLRALRTQPAESGAAVSCAVASPAVPTVIAVHYRDTTIWLTRQDCLVTRGDAVAAVPDFDALVDAALASAPDDATTAPDVGPALPPDTPVTAIPLPDDPVAGDPVPGDPGQPSDPVKPVPSCPPPTPTGEGAPVPFTPVSVQVCTLPVTPAPVVGTATGDASAASDLAARIAALAPLAADTACPAIGGQTWSLTFRAADGGSATLVADAGGCGTVSDGARSWTADPALFDRLAALR